MHSEHMESYVALMTAPLIPRSPLGLFWSLKGVSPICEHIDIGALAASAIRLLLFVYLGIYPSLLSPKGIPNGLQHHSPFLHFILIPTLWGKLD